MTNIELRLFRYFVTLCEERNFSRAAERLNITPPTLTNQIQKLERELNVRLLTRKTKMRVQLTEAGVRLLESARDVLHRVEEAEMITRKVARGEVGQLEIGYVVATAHAGLVQRLIGNFQKAHPSINVSLQHASTVDLRNAIVSSRLDAGFARLPNRFPSGLSGFPIYRAPLVIAVPSYNPLARKRSPIDPKALVDENFITACVSDDLAFTQNIESIATLGGFIPKISKRAEELTTMLTYVSAGYGIAVISQDMITCQLPNVTFKTIDATIVPEVVYAFMHRSNETAPASKALIDAMRTYALR
jgi:DNA-binding transcriptional LysR family regulator